MAQTSVTTWKTQRWDNGAAAAGLTSGLEPESVTQRALQVRYAWCGRSMTLGEIWQLSPARFKVHRHGG
jgi:hypothetical protein